jgi:hypothetical protein
VSGPRLSAWDRLHAWIVTGPVGRVVAFFADLGAFAWRSLRGRAARRGER